MAPATAPEASVTEPETPVTAVAPEPEVATPAAEEEEPKPKPKPRAKAKSDAVDYVVNVAIMGTRNGVKWPPAGESIAVLNLPEDEVAQYLALGYIRPAE